MRVAVKLQLDSGPHRRRRCQPRRKVDGTSRLAAFRRIPALVLLVIGVSGCETGTTARRADANDPSGDRQYRFRDQELAARFREAKTRCSLQWPEASCQASLRQLGEEERELFEQVRAHPFSDITESNYWHRGRLKFPSEIAQLLSQRASQPPAPIPPPVPQRSADCARPTYATDMLVCDDGALRQMDRDVADLTERAERAGVIFAPLLEDPEAWFKRRSLCAFSSTHRNCAVSAYRERLDVLDALLAARQYHRTLSVACANDQWEGALTQTASGAAAFVLFTSVQRPVGVAFATRERNGWRPYLRFDWTGNRLTLTPVEGQLLSCTTAPR